MTYYEKYYDETNYMALNLLLDWAIECGFGFDSFPEEYEKYKEELTDDMSYKEMMIHIAKRCIEDEK